MFFCFPRGMNSVLESSALEVGCTSSLHIAKQITLHLEDESVGKAHFLDRYLDENKEVPSDR